MYSSVLSLKFATLLLQFGRIANSNKTQVLRFRCAPDDDKFMVGAEENKQKQGQMQVLRLRCASLRMTIEAGQWGMGTCQGCRRFLIFSHE